MNNQRYLCSRLSAAIKIITSLSVSLVIVGCPTAPSSVMVTSATVIGVDISQDPATQTPSATLGYKRAEFAYVPTNKGTSGKTETTTSDGKTTTVTKDGQPHTGAGAKDSANALMELRYSGIFSTQAESGIYQRVAVGNIAVRQQGASVLFAKNAKGEIDGKAAEFVSKAKIQIENDETHLKTIITFLKDSAGALDTVKRDTLIAKAKINNPATITTRIEAALKGPATLSDLNSLMSDDLSETIAPMYEAIP